VPSNTGEFAERIAALAGRIRSVRERLVDTSGQQSVYLQTVAASELSAQKQRLAEYAVQARFALADIYDRAADHADSAPAAAPIAPYEPAAPAPPATPAPEPR
jgi:hypothetical protein